MPALVDICIYEVCTRLYLLQDISNNKFLIAMDNNQGNI